jgi:hypothetical protein
MRSTKTLTLAALPPALFVLLAPVPAMARDQCVAIMQLIGVPAQVAAASDEGGDDKNGDGEIWISTGGGRMMGFIDCSDMPGSVHGDTYEQNYGGGEPRKTGNSQASGQLGRKWFNESAARHSSSTASNGSGGNSSSSSSSPDDARPAQNQSPIAKKKKPVAQTQR